MLRDRFWVRATEATSMKKARMIARKNLWYDSKSTRLCARFAPTRNINRWNS